MAFTDKRDKVAGVRKIGPGRGLARCEVAAQRQDVADAAVPELIQVRRHFVAAVVDAREVAHRPNPEILLHPRRQIDRRARAATGARDRDEVWVEGLQVRDSAPERGDPGVVFGREELETEGGTLGFEEAVDAHGGSWRIVPPGRRQALAV